MKGYPHFCPSYRYARWGARIGYDQRSIRPSIRRGHIFNFGVSVGSGRLQQSIQAHAHGRREAGMDGCNALVLVGSYRRTNDARDPVGGWWLDAERPASGLSVCGKLGGVAGFADSMVAQPGAKRLSVGNARFPETEQGAYLCALPLRRAVVGIGHQRCCKARLRHAKAARQFRYCGFVYLSRCARKSPTSKEEQQHDRETQPVGQPLRLDQRTIRERQIPDPAVNGAAHAGQ